MRGWEHAEWVLRPLPAAGIDAAAAGAGRGFSVAWLGEAVGFGPLDAELRPHGVSGIFRLYCRGAGGGGRGASGPGAFGASGGVAAGGRAPDRACEGAFAGRSDLECGEIRAGDAAQRSELRDFRLWLRAVVAGCEGAGTKRSSPASSVRFLRPMGRDGRHAGWSSCPVGATGVPMAQRTGLLNTTQRH